MLRRLFAYPGSMSRRFVSADAAVNRGTKSLREELSFRGRLWSRQHPHEQSYGSTPSFVFQENDGVHGNFLPDSYIAIKQNAEWAKRLEKAYAAGKWIPLRWERKRRELDCANSSDALLMNIFCYPGLLEDRAVCSLLGVDCGVDLHFGFKPRLSLVNEQTQRITFDNTEVDMSLGCLLVEAKLTESGFQSAPMKRLLRYRDIEEVFEIENLPTVGASVQSYQLIRGVLAAHQLDRSFVVLCDARRPDLIEKWFRIMRAVQHCGLRHRLAILSWQELSAVLPSKLRNFLDDKYGIHN